MDPATIATGLSVATSIWGQAQAQAREAESAREAQRILDEARNEINSLVPPDPESQKIFLEQFKSAGVLTPELEQSITSSESAYKDIKEDPQLRQAQLDALSQMQQMGKGEMTAGDRYSLAQIQDTNRQQEKGARDAIMQSMQRRGVGGSGQELMAKLAAQQSAADRNSQQGMQQQAMIQQRALDAIMQGGNLAGDMRSQDHAQQADIAAARDAMSRFNAGLMSGTQ